MPPISVDVTYSRPLLAAVIVAAAGATVCLGATTASASPRRHNPSGKAVVHTSGRTAQFTGWAVDRDAPKRRVTVVRLIDGYHVGASRTRLPNSAVTKRYHAAARPGFDVSVTVPANGRAHTACVAARNLRAGAASLLKCVTLPAGKPAAVASHGPFGWTAGHRHRNTVTFTGRATDPDFRSRRATVVLYVDGNPAGTVVSHRVRSGRKHGVGINSAFSVATRVTPNRAHVGCVWAVDLGPGGNSLLGCRRFELKSHATDRQTAGETRMLDAVVALAKKQFHKPYVWAAEGPHAFDCSGLVQWTYKKNGYLTPRVAEDQFAAAHIVTKSHARPGDLVFYYNHEGYVHHVGIYVSPGMTVAAMSPDLGIGYQPVAQTPGWDGSYVTYGSFTHS